MVSPRTILIVDDEPGIREMLAQALRDEGFVVHTAPNGQAAIKLLEQAPGYVVLLDVMMPLLDGYQVLDWLQQAHRQEHHTIILLSAACELTRVRALLESGRIACFISKPFDLEHILKLIHSFMA